jgi:serine/threonine protein kinase
MGVHFRTIEIIGTGGFGKVWKVQDKSSKHYYAMKEMNKMMYLSNQYFGKTMFLIRDERTAPPEFFQKQVQCRVVSSSTW